MPNTTLTGHFYYLTLLILYSHFPIYSHNNICIHIVYTAYALIWSSNRSKNSWLMKLKKKTEYMGKQSVRSVLSWPISITFFSQFFSLLCALSLNYWGSSTQTRQQSTRYVYIAFFIRSYIHSYVLMWECVCIVYMYALHLLLIPRCSFDPLSLSHHHFSFCFPLQRTASNESQVVLDAVTMPTSGKYSCEVSADAPSFHTLIAAAELEVIGK